MSDAAEDRQAAGELNPPIHPATAYFAQRFRNLADDDGTVRRLTPAELHELLAQNAPDLAVSQRQIYRYYDGTATPRIDVVWELARVFGVSPQEFLPADTTGPPPRQ